MPQPTNAMVHIDRPMTTISTAYIQDASDFIAGQVFPVVPVMKQSDLYFTYLKEDFLRDDGVAIRVDGMETPGTGYRQGEDSYNCRVYGVHKDLGPQLLANADAPLNPSRDSTIFVTRRLLLRRERMWSTRYFQAGVWANDYVGQAGAGAALPNFTQWDNFADSDPRRDVRIARLRIKATTGFAPNTMVLGEEVFETLKAHPDLSELFKYTTGGLLNTARLAETFDVQRIIVGGAVYTDSAEQVGANAGATYDFVHGNHAWIGYVNPKPSLMEPSAGYIFAWKGLLGSGAFANRINRIDTPLLGLGSYRIEGEMAYDMKVVGADLGAFFQNAVS